MAYLHRRWRRFAWKVTPYKLLRRREQERSWLLHCNRWARTTQGKGLGCGYRFVLGSIHVGSALNCQSCHDCVRGWRRNTWTWVIALLDKVQNSRWTMVWANELAVGQWARHLRRNQWGKRWSISYTGVESSPIAAVEYADDLRCSCECCVDKNHSPEQYGDGRQGFSRWAKTGFGWILTGSPNLWK